MLDHPDALTVALFVAGVLLLSAGGWLALRVLVALLSGRPWVALAGLLAVALYALAWEMRVPIPGGGNQAVALATVLAGVLCAVALMTRRTR
jgi:hypothetical protein